MKGLTGKQEYHDGQSTLPEAGVHSILARPYWVNDGSTQQHKAQQGTVVTMHRIFSKCSHWLVAGALLSSSAYAPAQTPDTLSAEVKWTYSIIKNNLVKLAEKMPAENYSFRPTTEVETFGQRVAHIADANMNVCTGLNGERKPLGAASKTSKTELVAALKESFAYCDGVFDSLTDATAREMVSSRLGGPFPPEPTRSRLATLYNLVRHSNEMYGYMAVYLRLKGVVPPTSAPE